MAIDYGALADDFRQQATDLLLAADALDKLAGRHGKRNGRPQKAIKATTGTNAVVLSVIRDGSDTVKAIASSAKLKEFTARSAILALEKAGKVKRQGKGSLTRYVAA